MVGVDIIGGKPPSPMQMFRIAANVEFREAAKRVATELQNAGIKLDSQVRYPLSIHQSHTVTNAAPFSGSHGRVDESEKRGF